MGLVGAGPDVFSVVSDWIRGFHRSQRGSFTTSRGVASVSRLRPWETLETEKEADKTAALRELAVQLGGRTHHPLFFAVTGVTGTLLRRQCRSCSPSQLFQMSGGGASCPDGVWQRLTDGLETGRSRGELRSGRRVLHEEPPGHECRRSCCY